MHAKIHHPPYWVAPSTVIPCGKPIEPMRMPELMALPVLAATAGMFALWGVSSGWTSGRRNRFAEQVIGRDLWRSESGIQYQVIAARRSQEVWQTRYSWICPHNAWGRDQSNAVSPGETARQ